MSPLFAHLMETGFGGFYDGIAHLLITPADLLLVLVSGQRPAPPGARGSKHQCGRLARIACAV
mgnify:CR=1 FL=1